jgi:aerobic-type carbon monoxide dehydrogenase small subunit (CoxS/CutS family)
MQPEAFGSDPRAHLTLVVNGKQQQPEARQFASLLEVLRDDLGLTGTKEACGRGECGACTVLVGGLPHLSCITLAALVDGPVMTIEGLAEDWSDLRQAFADWGGFQCGFCTSGQIVHAAAILSRGLPQDREEAARHLRHSLSGNICRCTGYVGIVAAVLSVAEKRGLLRGGTAP